MQNTFSQQFQTIVLFTLIGVLVLGMAASFGPQMDGCVQGGQAPAMRVYGEAQSQRDVNAVYRLAGFDRQPVEQQRNMELRTHVAQGIVDRALLAREARDLGYDSDEDEIMREFVMAGIVRISLGPDAPAGFPYGSGGIGGGRELRMDLRTEDGQYDQRQIDQRLRWLGLTPGEFALWQVEEALAQRMRLTVVESVSVGPSEVWAAYEREREQASIAYVRFSPRYYRDQLQIDEAALTAWMAEHSADIDRDYAGQRARFTGLAEQVRARHILIKYEETDSDEVKAAARARATALLRRARAGEDFGALARANSEDTGTATLGGDLGYNERGRMVPQFDAVQFALAVNEISDLVETRFGVHIIQVTGKREGDVPEAEAKREIAEGLYREERAGQLALEAATRALAELRGGVTPEQLGRTLQGLPLEAPVDAEGNPVEEDVPDLGGLAPTVENATGFGRAGNPIRGVDGSALVRAVFDMPANETMPSEPLRLGTEYVIFQVTDRQSAVRDDFTTEEQTRIRDGLLASKQREVLALHIAGLRAQAERDDAIFINPEILRYGDEPEDAPADEEEDDDSAASATPPARDEEPAEPAAAEGE
ncbi:MAG: peptidylprolyl isomerase [Myxococcales bacterium]|nr:peptidylprolyl isomerase [Myxococcales bacterium]